MITWDDFDKIWASTSPLTPYSFSDPNYAQGWNFVGSTPPARQMWDSIQKQNDEKFKYLRDNFGTPNIVTQASQMTDTEKVYVYLGSEAGWNSGHWYYYDEGTSSWADGGVYNSVAFVTDTTLSIAGQPADAKATGDALALKSDLAGCTFTGNVGINADLSVTGDATIGTDLSVTGVSTLTGNVSAGADVIVVGDVSSANLTTSADATIGGNLSVTGTSTLAGNITTSGDISADNISATTNATVGGNLSVTGTSTLTGNINAGADITVVGDVSADNLTTTTNATVGGNLSVAGTSTLTGNVTANGNISAVGDISSANLTTTNATIGGNATVTGDVSCANLTTSADASVGGDLTVTGDSALADASVNDLVVNNDLSVAGDSSLTNLSVSGTTALAGTSTAPTPSADDNSTNIATTEYVQTEIKPIEVNADIVNKRVTNIEKLLEGNLYDYQTDNNSAYTKTVPSGAMPYASLDEVGGKTLVWNQLLNAGTISVATTDTGTQTVGSFNGVNSHKYLLIWYQDTTLTSNTRNTMALDDGPGLGSAIYEHSGSNHNLSAGWYSWLVTPTTLTNGTFTVFYWGHSPNVAYNITNIMCFDLTLMYGSGNEPSIVAEFQQMFPAVWYAYNPGSLLSAGVTEVVSVGKNMWNSNDLWLDTNSGITINSTDSITISTQSYQEDRNKYSVDGSAGQYTMSCSWKCTSVGNHEARVNVRFEYTDGTRSSVAIAISSVGQTGTFTETSTNGKILSYIHFGAWSYMGTVELTNIQLEKSATVTTYSPYKEISYPIPAEIQALEGYGWSAGSVYNYIDYERKVFVRRVAGVDMGTLNWRYYDDTFGQYFRVDIADKKDGIANIVNPKYFVYGAGISTITTETGMAQSTNSPKAVYVVDPNYANAQAFISAMDGVMLYYELDTPVEVDISAYLTDDNLIEVEANGTLTFPNSNGTDYQIPVPSSETYMVDLQASL